MRIKSRIFTVFLSLFMLVNCISPAYAEGTPVVGQLSDAKIVEMLGVLVGEGSGITAEYLAKTPTRIQAAIMYLRLKGLEAEAEVFQGKDNFTDAGRVEWARNILAYLKVHPELGMVGVGNNLFSPETTMTAQGYYKVLLEALGYKQGVDFNWEDVFTFAASKGMSKVAGTSKFTVDNLATATVEALRAKLKDSSDNLATFLVKTGRLKEEQLKLLNTAPTPLPFTASFELSVKSSSELLIKFDKAVEDISKVVFTVTRDANNAEVLAATWNSSKTEAILSKSDRLMVGTYTVTILYGNTFLGTKTAVIEAEKLVAIEFSPQSIIRVSDIKGEVIYRAKNQYGEDIKNIALTQNIKWTVSEGTISVDQNNSKLTIIKDGTSGTSQLKDIKNLWVTGVDFSSNVTIVKQLEITSGVGLIKDFRFTGVYNNEGKTEITTDTTDRFYINYEALDADGKKVDSYTILSNLSTFALYASNVNIAAHVVRDPENMNKALIEIDTRTAAGVSEIRGIALATGKADTIRVEVKPGSEVSEFVIDPLSKAIAVNEKVELKYRAIDQKGNLVTKYESIQGKVVFMPSDSSNAIISGERKADGTFGLYATFGAVKQYMLTTLVTGTGKTSSVSIETTSPAVPSSLAVINREVIYPAIVENGQITVDFFDNPAFKVLDQNGNEINLVDRSSIDSSNYYIYVRSLDPMKVRANGSSSIVYRNSQVTLTGGNVRGTTSVVFELCKDTDIEPSNGKTVVDSKEVLITNIDKTKIVKYELSAIPTLYANPSLLPQDTNSTISFLKQQYAADIKVIGLTSTGEKVALSAMIGSGNDILNLTVTDTAKFSVDLGKRKVIAKAIPSGTEASDRLTATLMGYSGQILTVSTELKSSKETPVASAIEVTYNKDSDYVRNLDFVRSGDSFIFSAGVFNTVLVGRELKQFNAIENLTSSPIIFVVKDQYGKYTLQPSYFSLNKVQGSGSLSIDAVTGLLSGIVSSGDQYTITAVTNNGLLKTITINIR